MTVYTGEYRSASQGSNPDQFDWDNLSNCVDGTAETYASCTLVSDSTSEEEYFVSEEIYASNHTLDSTAGDYIEKVEVGVTYKQTADSTDFSLYLYLNAGDGVGHAGYTSTEVTNTSPETLWYDITDKGNLPGAGNWEWTDINNIHLDCTALMNPTGFIQGPPFIYDSTSGDMYFIDGTSFIYYDPENPSHEALEFLEEWFDNNPPERVIGEATVYIDTFYIRVTTGIDPGKFGLRCYDSTGNITLDITDRITRVIYQREVESGVDGSDTFDSSMGEDRYFAFAIPLDATNGELAHNIETSGNTITWTANSSSVNVLGTDYEVVGSADSLITIVGW